MLNSCSKWQTALRVSDITSVYILLSYISYQNWGRHIIRSSCTIMIFKAH